VWGRSQASPAETAAAIRQLRRHAAVVRRREKELAALLQPQGLDSFADQTPLALEYVERGVGSAR
jgi:hypothetical protein